MIRGTSSQRTRIAVAIAALLAGMGGTQAASLLVPNGSFESQSGAGQPFGVNVLIDSWQKLPNPGIPEGGPNNFFWVQTAGAFLGTPPTAANPYSNLDGSQAAYLLSIPGSGIFQDDQSTDWTGTANGLSATYEVGQAYTLTVGVFGKGMVDDFSSLQLSLYYRDGANHVTIGTPTTVTFDTSVFNPAGPFSLHDYSVNLPSVQAGDAWANKNIGIQIATGQGTGDGYWDMDNVRLVSTVPEPGTIALAAVALTCLGMLRMRARQRV